MAKAAACSREMDRRAMAPVSSSGDQLFDDQDDPVVGLVVGDADRPDHPGRLGRLLERELVGEMARALLVPHDAGQVVGHHCHLLLLDLEGEQDRSLPALEEEEAVADRAHRSRP